MNGERRGKRKRNKARAARKAGVCRPISHAAAEEEGGAVGRGRCGREALAAQQAEGGGDDQSATRTFSMLGAQEEVPERPNGFTNILKRPFSCLLNGLQTRYNELDRSDIYLVNRRRGDFSFFL
jgi:hypothetical protein